jgi:hypothetical protein
MKARNTIISIFVIVWLVVFNYESIRHFYLEPLFQRSLPKMKFLFPPAGWIMFYNVDDSYGTVQVYGVKEGRTQLIDPHQILQTRAIGYDNIHRNALVGVLNPGMAKSFCTFLYRKFPYFDNFVVTYINYPSLIKEPFKQEQNIVYECK